MEAAQKWSPNKLSKASGENRGVISCMITSGWEAIIQATQTKHGNADSSSQPQPAPRLDHATQVVPATSTSRSAAARTGAIRQQPWCISHQAV